MMWQPAGQVGGRLVGERHYPAFAPGHPELDGRPALVALEDVSELQGAHLAGTQADVTQQPQDGPVAHPGRGLKVGHG
jgi:hypothetical protein